MCEDDGYKKLAAKALMVILLSLFAIFRPDILFLLFNYTIVAPVKIYHVFWALAVFVLIKRMVPRFNPKMSSGKIFRRNWVNSGSETMKRREAFRENKRKTDSGAFRSGLYWLLLLSVMGM